MAESLELQDLATKTFPGLPNRGQIPTLDLATSPSADTADTLIVGVYNGENGLELGNLPKSVLDLSLIHI